jgi:protein SCO1/2
VRFFDDLIKDKVVAINFIFTGCGDSCPVETARLRQVQKLLGDRVGQDIFFYSISIDPYNDTPTTLKRYAEKFAIGPGWTLLTGEAADIEQLRRSLGLYIEGLENGRSKDHNLSLIIGNQSTGRWMKASPFESPYILADRLANSLHNWKTASAQNLDYTQAPAIRPPSAGEQLFRTRCSSCHTVGEAERCHRRDRAGPAGGDPPARRSLAETLADGAGPDAGRKRPTGHAAVPAVQPAGDAQYAIGGDGGDGVAGVPGGGDDAGSGVVGR